MKAFYQECASNLEMVRHVKTALAYLEHFAENPEDLVHSVSDIFGNLLIPNEDKVLDFLRQCSFDMNIVGRS